MKIILSHRIKFYFTNIREKQLSFSDVLIILTSFIFLFILILLLFRLKDERARAASVSTSQQKAIGLASHTSATTHQMRVFDSGRITDSFLNDLKQNQVDKDPKNPDATKIAISFRQHKNGDVDVGTDDDFVVKTPITLNDPSLLSAYSEDTITVYENTDPAIPYQITQQTFTVDSTEGDWLTIQFLIQNLGVDRLTEGKFMFMLDMDVAELTKGDTGRIDKSRNLVYSSDFNNGIGYAMGMALLAGEWDGFGIKGNGYPKDDTTILDEMDEPQNSIMDGANNVSWIVVNIDEILPGEEKEITFGLCAVSGTDELGASLNLIQCIDSIEPPEPSALKIENAGPLQAKVKDSVTYNYDISHSPESDQSSITLLSVTDDVAGNAHFLNGDKDADGELDFNETWRYQAMYTISPADDNFLINTTEVKGFIATGGSTGKIITATASHALDVEFSPSLSARIDPHKNSNDDNENETYSLFINNDLANGDGSDLNLMSISITNDANSNTVIVAPETCLPKGKKELLSGESLECLFNFNSDSDQVNVITATIVSLDKDSEESVEVFSYRKCCLIHLPTIIKYQNDPQCNIETMFDPFDPNLPKIWREQLESDELLLRYLSGEYQMYAINPEPLFYEIRKDGRIYSNYRVVADVRWVESEDATSGEGIGLIFNYNRVNNDKVNSYIFLVDTYQSRYNLARYLNASPEDNPVSLTGGWRTFPTTCLNGGRFGQNTLTVVSKIDKIEFKINECGFNIVNDNVIPSGQVGLAVQGFLNHPVLGSPKADGRFDDLHIYSCGSSKDYPVSPNKNLQLSNFLSRAK